MRQLFDDSWMLPEPEVYAELAIPVTAAPPEIKPSTSPRQAWAEDNRAHRRAERASYPSDFRRSAYAKKRARQLGKLDPELRKLQRRKAESK
jgi:hypothetical protein